LALLPGHDDEVDHPGLPRTNVRKACAGTNNSRAPGVTVQSRTEARMPIRFDDLVDDVMSGAPQTIRVFLEFKMRCVGCPIACFHTVDDACREHGADRDAFLRALSACVTA
jgi:hybrid cluster-associated redox disulfide protein